MTKISWNSLTKEEKKKRTIHLFPLLIVCYVLLFSTLDWYKALVISLLLTISYQLQYNKYSD
mgnify:CR=1 FL=1